MFLPSNPQDYIGEIYNDYNVYDIYNANKLIWPVVTQSESCLPCAYGAFHYIFSVTCISTIWQIESEGWIEI